MITLINKASGLNLRTEPTLSSKSLGSLGKEEHVEFIEFDASKQWAKIRRTNGTEGWSNYKYLIAEISSEGFPTDPTWLRIAYGEYGIAEWLVATKSNPEVEKYLRSCSSLKYKDDTAWCSAFVNWCMEKAGNEGTDDLWAQSWKNWGQKVDTPFRGCVVVFKRFYEDKDSGKVKEGGHVGFYLSEEGKGKISILGGNQSDQVIVKSYPLDNLSNPPKSGEYKLIGYRKPMS